MKDSKDQDVETRVRKFYDTEGWVPDAAGRTGEDRYYRDHSDVRSAYDEKIRQQTVRCFEGLQGILLIAGGGDLPQSHLLVAQKFEKVICVDISSRALEISKSKLGAKGDYRQASMLALPLQDESVDAVLCAHVLYHIDKRDQAQAVREMIRVSKPGARVVILYRNPHAPFNLMQRFLQSLRLNKALKTDKLYVRSYPGSWWSQFGERCNVQIQPSDAMSPNQARFFLPGRALRKRFFRWAAGFEDQHPNFAARLWSYSRIVLDLRTASGAHARSL
jgi:SAM-dependent methyltransferase